MKTHSPVSYEIILLLFIGFSEGEICYQKFRRGSGGFCKKVIRRQFTDAASCCTPGNARGGYANLRIPKFPGSTRRGFVCEPCAKFRLAAVTNGPEVTTAAAPAGAHWSGWSEWGRCSVTCQAGFSRRSRLCNNGDSCRGTDSQVKPCSETPHCPINGNWGQWHDWGACTVSCEGGTQDRQRTCTDPKPQYGGKQCPGKQVDARVCNTEPCPIDGGWGDWTAYSSCSKSCGKGEHHRTRECNKPLPQFGGNKCPGTQKELKNCKLRECPVHGMWSQWSAWTPCVVTCGKGVVERVRTCNSPRPQYGGDPCQGEKKDTKECQHRRPCPVHGQWSVWSRWSKCVALRCTGIPGKQRRSRACNNPRPKYRGKYCIGNNLQRQNCNSPINCPLNGGWCNWEEWGPCSSTCGVQSYQRRIKTCLCPAPLRGGNYCQGKKFETNVCKGLPECPLEPIISKGSGSGSGDRSDLEADQES